MTTIDKFLRGIFGTANWDYSELEECDPDLIADVKEQTLSYLKEVIKADRENVVQYARIQYINYDYEEINKDSIINAPNIILE